MLKEAALPILRCTVLLAAFAFGYFIVGHLDEAGYNRAVSEYKTKESAALKAERETTLKLQGELAKVSGDLAAAQLDIEKRNRTITKLEDKYATLAQNSDLCNHTVGSIMLYNASLGYGLDTGKLESEGGALSTVTGAAFASACRGLAGTFEQQRAQLNALIDATDKLERVCGRSVWTDDRQ